MHSTIQLTKTVIECGTPQDARVCDSAILQTCLPVPIVHTLRKCVM
jgi:hypothetical protein